MSVPKKKPVQKTPKKLTSKQVKPRKIKQQNKNNNPKGKGGFKDNPQNRSDGRWSPEQSISYNYNKLIRLSPQELADFKPTTVAEEIALARIKNARSRMVGLKDTREITDRTEGKAPQSIDLTTDGKPIEPVTVRIVNEPARNPNSK